MTRVFALMAVFLVFGVGMKRINSSKRIRTMLEGSFSVF